MLLYYPRLSRQFKSTVLRDKVWRLALVLALINVFPVRAQEAVRNAAAIEERTPAQWLQAIQNAAQRMSYSGTFIYQYGGAMRSSRVVHLFENGVAQERLQMLDGKPREFVRRAGEVQCLYPESRKVLVDRWTEQENFPSLGTGAPTEILERYALKVGGIERVAGLECQQLELEPKDTLRYGYRLCVERASTLLLKAQTLNEQHDPVEQFAFTDVRIGGRIDRSALKPSWSTDGWKVERTERRPVDLASYGWSVPPLSGFRRLRDVERKMGHDETARTVLQSVFTDGIATLSIFIEAGAGTRISKDLLHSHGATSGYSRRVGDALVTVVGDVPPAAVKSAAQAVEYQAPLR